MAPINLGKLVEKALTRRWYLDGFKPGNRFSTSLDDKRDILLEFTFNYENNYTLRVRAEKELGFWHYDGRSKRGRSELYPLAQHLLERFPEQRRYIHLDSACVFEEALTADGINARL